MITLLLGAAMTILGTAPPLPEIAGTLPPTWPPPGWPTKVELAATESPCNPPLDKWLDVFPHVRINRALKAVELDGTVPWDFHNPDTPRTELELLVCLPNRDKEHESLVLSKAKGAHVHAALLMVGLEPGQPGRIEFGDGKNPGVKRFAPVGPFVSVSFRYLKDGKERVDNPRLWVVDEAELREEARRGDVQSRPNPRKDISYMAPAVSPTFELVFGGSKVGQMRNERGEKANVYNADELGCLIGLCTFGHETIGNTTVISPDSGLDTPRFIGNNRAIPPADTAVRVRIEPDTRVRVQVEPERPIPLPASDAAAGSNKTPAQRPPSSPAPRP